MGQMIYIRSLKQHSWSGFHRFPKCKDTIVAASGRGGYETGLSKEDESRLEQELRLEPGTLGRFSDYWIDYSVIIMDRDLELDLDNPKDFLDYKLLMASERVANSQNERSNWPKAEYVVYDAEEDAKKENLKVKEKRKAYKTFNGMTHQKMRDVLKLMGRRAENSSNTLVENTLSDLIEKDPSEFNILTSQKDFKIRVLLEDLIQENIVRRKGATHYYGDINIGYDLDAAVSFLENPKNQELVLNLKQKLKAHVE